MKLRTSLASLSIALGVGLGAGVWADCTGPAAHVGGIVYAASQNTMVFCDGTNWVIMSGGTNVTIGGNTNNPGGSNTYVQYNNGTAFAGDAGRRAQARSTPRISPAPITPARC